MTFICRYGRFWSMTNYTQHPSSAEKELELLETVCVGGYPTVRADRAEIAAWVGRCCAMNASHRGGRPPLLVYSSNGQGIALAGRNADYDSAMEAADAIHADGMPVVHASRILTSKPIRGRSATTDLFHDIADVAQERDLSLFVLGGEEGENASATEAIRRLYPSLRLSGRKNGFFKRDQDALVCAEVVSCGTDILLVGMGKPLQEIWSHQNQENLRGVGAIITCGGLYTFLTGRAPRAPIWMQDHDLEWLHRLMHDPSRLFYRYLTTNMVGGWRLLTRTGGGNRAEDKHRT